MTETQKLVAEYAGTGSEAAFRELVGRYVGLVYSTAVRLVNGDRQLAEDVAQTVFVHLAQKASKLPPEVMLGGWLHRDTCHVAATVMRGERRRQCRERRAAEMNTSPDHTQDNLAEVAPVLDEAIDQLPAEDRTAILLRFFEQREFALLGEVLGISEDGARKRVGRALQKLESLLKRRGLMLSAAALGTMLGVEAVSAAPAWLAANITGAALASTAAGGGGAFTLFKIMATTKIKLAVIGAILAAGVATPLIIQHQAQVKLRAENQGLRQQLEQLGQVAAENERLSNLVARAASQPGQDEPTRELLRLRGEAGALRSQLDSSRKENRQLQSSQAQAAASPAPAQQSDTAEAQRAFSIAKMTDAKLLLMGMMQYARANSQQFATQFDQIEPYLRGGNPGYTGTNQFELMYQGSLRDITNPAQTIVVRETQAWQTADGGWCRAYGFADGHSEIHRANDGNFDAWEKEHLQTPPSGGQ